MFNFKGENEVMDVEEFLDPSKLALSSETRAEKAKKKKNLKKQSKRIVNAGTAGKHIYSNINLRLIHRGTSIKLL